MITVVGMDGSALGPQAEAALAAATLVVGARRHLAAVPALTAPSRARTIVLGELAPALDALAAHDGGAVILASGDPGFFGIVRALRERGLGFTVLPAVSSVALAFARVGLAWDDAVVVSAHGRNPRPAVNVCRAHPKVAVLTGPGCGPAEIGTALNGWDRRLVVAEHLGGEAERVTECSPAEAAGRTWEDPNVVLVLTEAKSVIMTLVSPERHQSHDHEVGASRSAAASEVNEVTGTAGPGWAWLGRTVPGGWALAEEEFDSRDAVITKAEVRALALARLGPGPGMLVWDVGAGSGSVGIECARFGAAVIAVERDRVRCERVRANAAAHSVDVRVVAGPAPQVLAELPDPDAVFVGGGGPEVIKAVAARHPARIVVALAAVERAGQAIAALDAAGYAADGTLVQAARLAPLPGGVHRLASTNPVFLVWATPGHVPGGPAGLRSPGSGATEAVGAGDHDGPGNPGTGPGAPR
jgi:precorrin-6B C5,15-methyltransferase / cobalt-precorrin-6B C5,C15-methyltransferase